MTNMTIGEFNDDKTTVVTWRTGKYDAARIHFRSQILYDIPKKYNDVIRPVSDCEEDEKSLLLNSKGVATDNFCCRLQLSYQISEDFNIGDFHSYNKIMYM